MLNNMWWTSHVKKKNCPTDLQFQFQYIRIRCRSWCLWQKKKPLWNLKEFFYIDILVEKGVTHDGGTISPRSSEASEGVKWLLQQETGCLFSKQHLITLSVSLLLLSLSFPPSALSHTIKFTSFSIPKSSTLYAEARLVTSFFFLFFPPFACWICSLLRSCSSFRTEQLHQCKCRIEEILNCPWSSSKWRWAQSMQDANIS